MYDYLSFRILKLSYFFILRFSNRKEQWSKRQDQSMRKRINNLKENERIG